MVVTVPQNEGISEDGREKRSRLCYLLEKGGGEIGGA